MGRRPRGEDLPAWSDGPGSLRSRRRRGAGHEPEFLDHHRWSAEPAARHRPRGDRRVAGVPRRGHRGVRPRPGPVPHAEAARASPGEGGRRSRPDQYGLHQHHSPGAGALVPRGRAHRTPHPGLHPVERGHHGQPGEPPGVQRRWSHRHLRLECQSLRSGIQPLLPGQGPSVALPRQRLRRPDLHSGSRFAGYLRAGLSGGPAHRAPAGRVPTRERVGRPVVLPASAPHAGLLGVPHGLDGARPDRRHLPGTLQPLPAQPPDQGHLR